MIVEERNMFVYALCTLPYFCLCLIRKYIVLYPTALHITRACFNHTKYIFATIICCYYREITIAILEWGILETLHY